MLNLKAILEVAKVYGAKLYDESKAVSNGSEPLGESFVLNAETNQIEYNSESGMIYIPILQRVVDAGFEGRTEFEIITMSAERDASGEFNGKPWSVAKGKRTLFAR